MLNNVDRAGCACSVVQMKVALKAHTELICLLSSAIYDRDYDL